MCSASSLQQLGSRLVARRRRRAIAAPGPARLEFRWLECASSSRYRRRGVGSSLRCSVVVSLGMALMASTPGATPPTTAEYRAGITAGSHPDRIAAGPDGNLWFTELDGGTVAKITPGGVVTEYGVGITGFPEGIAAGLDGNLWFTSFPDTLAKITPAGLVTEYRAGISADSFLEGIAAGPDGDLWFTESDGNRVAKITPAGVVTEYRAGLTAGSAPSQIAAGPDGNLWFTESAGDRVA